MTLRRLLAVTLQIVSLFLLTAPLLAQEPQTGFVPIAQAPPSEQIPAAPFVFIAYAIAWLAVLFYVWTIWRRLGRVEKELQDLQQRKAGSRAK
jgi:CcmD family protein